jgi:hypothetical protein
MRKLIFLVLFLWIAFIDADEESIEESSGSLGNRISFSMRAANPDSYDHSVGGGSFYDGVDKLICEYYACEIDIVSLFLQISTKSSFTRKPTEEWEIGLVPHYDTKVIRVLNNCVESETDASYSCSPCGASVVPSLYNDDYGPVLNFTGLKASTKTVIRIDMIIDPWIFFSLCECIKDPDSGEWSQECSGLTSEGYLRVSHISSAQNGELNGTHQTHDITKKRVIREGYNCETMDHDVYLVALGFNDYTVDGDYHQIPLVYVDFTNIDDILVCNDPTDCSIGEVSGKTGDSYKDRYCHWTPVSCDDGDPCTIDQCLPTTNELVKMNGNEPYCIHIDSCGSNEIYGYCHYIDRGDKNWDCSYGCYSDNDCEDGGICYYYIDYCEGSERNYCSWEADEDYETDCRKTCDIDSDCGDGETCYLTSDCPRFIFLQQEKSQVDDISKQQTTKELGLSSSQLGGIIGGCVVSFLVILMVIVLVIMKRSHQPQFNTEPNITLQIPLTNKST